MSSRVWAAALLSISLSVACSLPGRLSEPPATAGATQPAPAAPTPTEAAPLHLIYAPYANPVQQLWVLGPGDPRPSSLPAQMGSFYGVDPLTRRMLYAVAPSDHGAGPDQIAVSDLSIYDLTSDTSETLLPDNVVEALWAPNGTDLAYILATPETYELHWRTPGEDRVLARDVTFNWSIAPSGEAVAFTRESRYSLTRDPGLFVVRVSDGLEVKVADSDPQGFGSVSDQPLWSPDSLWVTMPLWATAEPRLRLARADGSDAIDLTIDPALGGEWWATPAIPYFLWDSERSRLVAAPAAGRVQMGGPTPIVVYDLDLERGLLSHGVLIAEVNALIGWDVPGRSVWVMSVDGVLERLTLP